MKATKINPPELEGNYWRIEDDDGEEIMMISFPNAVDTQAKALVAAEAAIAELNGQTSAPALVLIPKRVIVDRLQAAGLLEAAKTALDAADLYTQERWNSRMEIYADDPTAVALVEAIGGDPSEILAPE